MIFDIEWLNLKKEIDGIIIKDIETKLNIKFPKSYVEFIKIYHGSSPIPNIVKFDRETETLKTFLSMEPGDENFIVDVYMENRGLMPEDIIPIGLTDCIDLICLDYRKGRFSEPSVVYWNYEFALENYHESVYPICKTFEALINLLSD